MVTLDKGFLFEIPLVAPVKVNTTLPRTQLTKSLMLDYITTGKIWSYK